MGYTLKSLRERCPLSLLLFISRIKEKLKNAHNSRVIKEKNSRVKVKNAQKYIKIVDLKVIEKISVMTFVKQRKNKS